MTLGVEVAVELVCVCFLRFWLLVCFLLVAFVLFGWVLGCFLLLLALFVG